MSAEPTSEERYAHYELRTRPDGSPWLLGVGGMGMTYRAFDPRLRVEVALKVVHPNYVEHPEALRLFVREARAAARVAHPNVAPVVYLHDEPGRFFYAMEFVDGVSLHAWLHKHRALPAGRALAFAAQVARGLQAIHEQGIIHRDLKPANVMVVQFPPGHSRHRSLADAGGCLLKIIDFGLARGVEAGAVPVTIGPVTTGFRGTAAYASPEQCEEFADLDARTDLYSLGCILWEMLAGRPPFVGRSQFELLRQQVGAPLPWNQLSDLAPSARLVLDRLLAKSRDDRPGSAAEAAEEMEDAIRALATTDLAPGTKPPTRATAVVATHRTGGSAAAPPASAGKTPPPGTTPPPSGSTASATASTPATAARGSASLTVTLSHAGAVRFVVGALVLLALLATAVWWRASQNAPPPTAAAPPPNAAPAADVAAMRRVVAVLPFTNVGGDRENDFLADGLHEDILTGLAKVRGLRVIARSSVLKWRGRTVAAREVGRELGAGLVLAGSVRRAGSRLRLSVELISSENDQVVWSDAFDKELTDAFEIQAAVAREVTGQLAMNLSEREQRLLARRPTTSTEAYELFARGRFVQQRESLSRDAMERIISLYERAIALDPNFALAHAYLAVAHGEFYWYAYDQSPARLDLARASAERALLLQPELPEAHIALGEVYYRFSKDYEAALREYRLAQALEPSNPRAVEACGLALRRLGRWEEALAQFQLSVQLAPDDPQKEIGLAEQLYVMRRFAEAEPHYRRGAEKSGNASWETNLYLCRLELGAPFSEYEAALRRLLPRMDTEARVGSLTQLRDFLGALDSLALLPPVLAEVNVQVPRTLQEANLRAALGETAEARRLYVLAEAALAAQVAARPDDPFVLSQHAQALAGLGEKARVAAETRHATEMLPDARDAISHRYLQLERAEALARVGLPEEACEVLEYLLRVEIKFTRNHLRHFPEWDALRGYPRFERILAGK